MDLIRRIVSSRRAGVVTLLSALMLGTAVSATHQVHAAGSTLSNTLSRGRSSEAKTLDPAGNGQNPAFRVAVSIYDALLRLAPDGATLQPGLATSWTVSNAGTSYTFHVRKNVTVHDGETLTSADVRFCLLHTAEPQRLRRFLSTAIKGIDTPDPDELAFFGLDFQHGGAYSFYTWYNNRQLIQLSQAGELSNDPATRQKIYFQIQELWAKDAPFMSLHSVPFINAVSLKQQGFSENPLGFFTLRV